MLLYFVKIDWYFWNCRHLEENQISVIERGAFQDLKQLERL